MMEEGQSREGRRPALNYIDESVFRKVEEFKVSENYRQITSQISNLDDSSRSALSIIGTTLFFLIPVLVIGVLFWQVLNRHERIATKKDILLKAREIIQVQKSFNQGLERVLSRGTFATIGDAQSVLGRSVSQAGGSPSDYSLENLISTEAAGILTTKFELKFKQQNTKTLFNVLQRFVVSNRLRVEAFEIKAGAKNMLQGELFLRHLSRPIPAEEE